jgi:hypothetical protein
MACALRRYGITDSGNIPPTMRIIKPMQILIKSRLQVLPLPLKTNLRINRLPRFRMRFQAGVIFCFAIHLMLR